MVLPGWSRASLITIVLVFMVFTPAPHAGADDGPTCGIALTPCAIEPGVHNGTLRPHVNEADHYVFRVPDGPGVITVSGDADVVIELILRDANGHIRGAGWTLWSPEVLLTAASAPEGQWYLEIGYTPFSNPALAGNQYAFEISWSPRDNIIAFTGPPSGAPTVVGDIPAGSRAQIDVLLEETNHDGPLASRAVFETLWYITPEWGYASGGAGISCCGVIGDTILQSWGQTPDDLQIAAPANLSSPAQVGVLALPFELPTRFAYGLGGSGGIEPLAGYMAWDGNQLPALSFPEGGVSFAHRLSDFDGNGTGVFAAGYAHADDLFVEQELPEGQESLFYVNGESPAHAYHASRFSLTNTTGATTDISGNSLFYAFSDAPGGVWRMDAQHVDGRESATLRFTGASFPIDREWLLEAWQH